jgi:hypothetical protein
MSTYKDKSRSDEKHTARTRGYSHLVEWMIRLFHVVIVGWDEKTNQFTCDDIPHLNMNHGIPYERIIVCGFGCEYRCKRPCSHESRAVRWAQQHYPGVIASPFTGIVETVKWVLEQGFRLGSVNVDLCGALATALPIVCQVLAMVHRSLVLFTHNRRHNVNDEVREKLVTRECGRKPDDHLNYYSGTAREDGGHNRDGTAMRVNVFLPRYKCGTCGKLGAHPSLHECDDKDQNPLPQVEESAREPGVRYCSECGQPGHYAPTCGGVEEQTPAADVGETPTSIPERRKCAGCHEYGHNAQTCRLVRIWNGSVMDARRLLLYTAVSPDIRSFFVRDAWRNLPAWIKAEIARCKSGKFNYEYRG